MNRATLLALLVACHTEPKWAPHDDDAHATLIRLRIATDGTGFTPDDQLSPARFSDNAVQPVGELYACSERVETATRSWARKHQLVAARAEVHPQEVIFHFVADSASGRFELTYRRTRFTAHYPNAWPVPANENKEALVQTELVYTTRPANADENAMKRLIASYAIEPLMHDLYGAMVCGPDGKPPKLERPD